MPREQKPFQQEANRMNHPMLTPTVELFLTRGLKWWLALFCVVHLLGFAIMAGTDAHLWG